MIDESSKTTGSGWTTLLLAAILAAIALAVFWPATGYDFLNFDDDRYVLDNPHVNRGFTRDGVRWAFTAVYEDWWLPLLWLSYMADTEIWGTGAFGYHLTNVALHALNAALLFWALFRLTGSRWRSACAAALFALHPLRAESVAWIAERKDVLSGCFFLLGLLAYRRYAAAPARGRFWPVVLLMLLGLMSKGILIVFPFALLLLDAWPLRRAPVSADRAALRRWRPLLAEKIPLFLLTGAFVWVNLRTHSAASPVFNPLPLADRLGLVFPNVWAYLRQVFWPVRLAILHPEHDVVHWPAAAAALLGLAALTGLAWHQRGKRPYLLWGWLWFLLFLAPVLRGVRYSLASIADRFTYLPAIGLGVAVVWAAADLAPARRGRSFLLAALAAALLAACAARTWTALPLYRDSLAAFGNVLRHYPDHALVHNNYALALLDRGRAAEALPHFERAVANSRNLSSFTSNLGVGLIALGRADEALARMEDALRRYDADREYLHYAAGLAWLEKNDPTQAISHLRLAVEAPAAKASWRIDLARAYLEAGQTAAFSNEMARAVAAGSPLPPTFNGLCLQYLALWHNGHGCRAWTFFRRRLAENPENVPMINNAAWFLAVRPPPGADPAESLRLAEQACALNGDAHAGVLDTLAAALAANGRFEEAAQTAERAQQVAREAGAAALAEQIGQRLETYRRGQPWRE